MKKLTCLDCGRIIAIGPTVSLPAEHTVGGVNIDGKLVGGTKHTNMAVAEALPTDVVSAPADTTASTNKTTVARNVVAAQVARVRAIAPASRTDQDKWLLALTWLIWGQE